MKPYSKCLDWLRYLSAYMLFTYALSKLAGVQFTLPPDIGRRAIGSLSGYQLTWYYYGYSHVYASILGLTQLAGGSMLLFRKTALLGAALMTPVMVNILMINLFFHITVGAVCAAAFIFVSMVALLWRERGALLGLFWRRQNAEPAVPGRSKARPLYRAVLLVAIVVAQTVFGVLYSRR
jgi:hypothetical protein